MVIALMTGDAGPIGELITQLHIANERFGGDKLLAAQAVGEQSRGACASPRGSRHLMCRGQFARWEVGRNEGDFRVGRVHYRLAYELVLVFFFTFLSCENICLVEISCVDASYIELVSLYQDARPRSGETCSGGVPDSPR
jgi:hypothetical protein